MAEWIHEDMDALWTERDRARRAKIAGTRRAPRASPHERARAASDATRAYRERRVLRALAGPEPHAPVFRRFDDARSGGDFGFGFTLSLIPPSPPADEPDAKTTAGRLRLRF